MLEAACSRKTFLRGFGAGALLMLLSGRRGKRLFAAAGKKLPPRTGRAARTDLDLAVAKGKDTAAATRKAVDALGGMGRFVKSGDVVVVKPNIGWDRSPEQGANTHPLVVAALVAMCRQAGARTVKVFDHTCNDARRCYENSGIAEAAKKAGATVFYVSDWRYLPADMAGARYMNEWPVLKDAAECDVFINAPVAKHHGLASLTLSIKNLMGVCGGSRGRMHRDIDPKLVELAGFIKPDLTVIDASRILLRHGPTGGNLEDVKVLDTIIAGRDYVLADAYAATLFGRDPGEIGATKLAAAAGLGSMNLSGARIKTLSV